METEQNKDFGQLRRSRVFLVVFSLIVVLSVGIAFYRFFVLRDYPIQAQIDCDPYTESCFIYHCDPAVEECTGDPVADTAYYKILSRNAKNIPLCDQTEDPCGASMCSVDEEDCSITLCEEGSECSDPAVYSLENPIGDDGVAPDSQTE